VRQHVCDPNHRAASRTVVHHLEAGVVVLQPLAPRRVRQAPRGVVHVDDELARHEAIGERDDARLVAVHAAIRDKAVREAMHLADRLQRLPHPVGAGGDGKFLANGSHGARLRRPGHPRLEKIAGPQSMGL